MTLADISRELSLESLTPSLAGGAPGVQVDKAHASDLLSDVLANAPAGAVLLTIQVHMNVIAVALHAGLAAVVFTSGMVPDEAQQRLYLQTLQREAERQSHLVENVLAYSRLERGRYAGHRAVVDVGTLLASTLPPSRRRPSAPR